tara:strand:+ start:40618 stop:42087 length:1470 start_codon:yes stop_codon:yes gene_type:complete
MAIKKYYANKDNTITNAFQQNLTTRGTDANMGLSDILETFSIYGQASSGSTELERILIQFPVDEIITDRANNSIPEAGKVNFVLNMYNAPNNQTTPRELNLVVLPISSSWQEGTGLDMEEYKDLTYGGNGSNWINASSGTAWVNIGGDYWDTPAYSQIFPIGDEDLQVDITPLVEEWISGTKANYGIGVHLTSSQEAFWPETGSTSQIYNVLGSKETWYTKKFFGRGSEFFFKRPVIEAVWDSSVRDDRGNFYASSSLLPAFENERTLYLYNSIGGRLRNIPAIGTGSIYVKVYTSASAGLLLTPTVVTGGYVSTGIYSASFNLDTTYVSVYDRWFNNGLSICYHTGNFDVQTHEAVGYNPYPNYVTTLTNLRSIYYPHETSRFKFYVREKDWSPTIYTVANKKTDTLIIESGSYQIHRLTDNLIAIPYDTGSTKGTEMSFDVSGNYFDLPIKLLEPGYSYGIKVAYYDETVSSYIEQPHIWKFRVEEV